MKSDIYMFLIYSILVVGILYCVPLKWRNIWVLLSSMLFYLICDYRFFLLMLAETAVSYYLGIKIEKDAKCKRYLVIGIAFIIVILFVFKYFNLFIEIFASGAGIAELVMPVGISYFSFRMISYLADIYQKKRTAESSFVIYGAYVSFFPHMLCGPIARSEGMTKQLKTGISYHEDLFVRGCELIIAGMFKKVVIADRLGDYVGLMFQSPSGYPALALWMGAVFYSIQLYCDFSGYSDVAIGITNLMGIECESNFVRPYFATDIRMFWRRWHISLSQWLRDYIYIPLGGSRKGRGRHFLNVLITFLVCGAWHGSQLHYVIWGLYHGIWNMITPRKKSNGASEMMLLHLIRGILTFAVVMFGWILFRAESTAKSFEYIRYMFESFTISYSSVVQSVLPFTGDNSCLAYFICVMVMIAVLFVYEYRSEYKIAGERTNLIWSGIFLFCILLFGTAGGSSFLYANY